MQRYSKLKSLLINRSMKIIKYIWTSTDNLGTSMEKRSRNTFIGSKFMPLSILMSNWQKKAWFLRRWISKLKGKLMKSFKVMLFTPMVTYQIKECWTCQIRTTFSFESKISILQTHSTWTSWNHTQGLVSGPLYQKKFAKMRTRGRLLWISSRTSFSAVIPSRLRSRRNSQK